MSVLINWSTSELLVLMEAIQYCQKINLQDWGQVSLVVKQTMKETGVLIDKKYDEYGCSKQYNDFVITHKQELEKGGENIVDTAIKYLRQMRIAELEAEIQQRERHVEDLKASTLKPRN